MKDVYVSLKDFVTVSNKSESTIRLFIRENIRKYSNLFLLIGNRYYVHKGVSVYFNSLPKLDFLYQLNKDREMKIKKVSYKKEGSIKKELREKLGKEWDLFGHVNYRYTLSMDSCNYQFYKLEKILAKKISSKVEIFYTSERNCSGDGGHHNHFVVRIDNKRMTMEVKEYLDSFFRHRKFGLTDIRIYNPQLDGIGYIMKDIDRLTDGFGLIST